MVENSQMMRIIPFNVGEDHMTTSDRWYEWIEELELNLRVAGIIDPSKKKDVLLLYGGKEIRKLDKSLADSETSTSESDHYAKLKTKLTEYFSPKRNKYYNRYVFLMMRPQSGESTASYAARLREKTIGCEFHNDDERILEQLMITSDSQELIRKVIHKKFDLLQTLEAMRLIEDTSSQVEAMSKSSDIARVKRKRGVYTRHTENHDIYEKCRYCDRRHPKQKELFPAWGKTCIKCEKQNHFAVVCLSDRSPRNLNGRKLRDSREVRRTGYETPSEESDSECEQFMNHLKIGKVERRSISNLDGRRKRKCTYCGKAVTHKRKEDCKAYGRRCWNCKRKDHLMKVCRARYETTHCKADGRRQRNNSTCRSVAPDSEFSSDNKYVGERITDNSKLFEFFHHSNF